MVVPYNTSSIEMLQRPLESTLASVVAVMHDGLRSTLCERHVQRRQHDLGAQMRLDAPADDLARPHVEYDRQVQKPGPGRDVGDVGDPELIGPVGPELPLHQIVAERLRIGSHGRRDKALRHHTAKPCSAHQPRHALAAHPDAVLIGESLMRAGDPEDLVRALSLDESTTHSQLLSEDG